MNYGMDYQGGGGFGNSGSAGGSGYSGGGGSAGNSGGKARRSYDEQTMVPVTIRMCLGAMPDEISEGVGGLQLEDGRRLYHVRFVAAVRSFEDFSTNVVYTLEDGTGLMEVKQWLDDNHCTAIAEMRQHTLKENIYLKVVGQIKEYDGKKMVVAESIRVLSTGNELAHHMLEVVYAGETFKRKDSIVAPQSSMMFNTNTVKGSALHANSSDGGWKDELLRFIRMEGDKSDMGVSIDACIKYIGRPSSEVHQAVADFSSNGNLYSTIDENYYKFAM
jgi:replication factor A2